MVIVMLTMTTITKATMMVIMMMTRTCKKALQVCVHHLKVLLSIAQ